MKYANLIVMIAAIFICQSAAQTTKKILEPEYIGVFAVLDAATGKLSELERQTPEAKIKVKAMGFGGGTGYMQIKGEKSPVRFTTNQKLEFVVRVSSQAVDPMSIIQFFAFESKKGMRRLTMSKVGAMGMSSKSTTSENSVSFNVAKYGESSFKVVPANTLPAGEYCLSGSGTQDGFCFGVDGGEAESKK